MCRLLLRRGFEVYGVDLNEVALEALQAQLGPQFHPRCLDVCDQASMQALAEEIGARHHRLELLHNNAGILAFGDFDKLSLEQYRRVMEVNFWAPLQAIRCFLPLLRQASSPCVINTASAAGLLGFPLIAPYTVSKFALVGLGEALACELATDGIHILSVCPPAVRTALFDHNPASLSDTWQHRINRALERFALEPEALAEAILDAVIARRHLLVPGRELALLHLLKRSAPEYYLRLWAMVGRIRASRRR
jgi:NAD(P)-dependent dehydrogenase (short-subunit alcohol dehydrogenase family)